MTSKFQIRRATLTPHLKRSQQEHIPHFMSLRTSNTDSRLPKAKVINQSLRSTLPSFSQMDIKDDKRSQTKTVVKDQKERLKEQIEDVEEINDAFKEYISQDFKKSMQGKERKWQNHKYEQAKKAGGNIWVDYQPQKIPQVIIQKVQQRGKKQDKQPNTSQGFLPSIGVFYYVIENQILFFDTKEYKLISTQTIQLQTSLFLIYSIQIITLGEPYFSDLKDIMIVLLPYKGVLYEFKVQHEAKENRRKLILNKLKCQPFYIPKQKPGELYVSSKGKIYCTDNNGKIFNINLIDEEKGLQKSGQLVLKQLKASTFSTIKTKTKHFASSLSYFVKCMKDYRQIKDYSFSFFKKRNIDAIISMDEQREIILVLISDKTDKIQQNIVVYHEQTHEELYIINASTFIEKKQEIKSIKKLQFNQKSRFNFLLLLSSGRRVVLDVDKDKTNQKKPIFLKSPFLKNIAINTQIKSSFLQENSMGLVTDYNGWQLLLTTQGQRQSQAIIIVDLKKSNQFAQINYRSLQILGHKKQQLLTTLKGTIKVKNAHEYIRQVFYHAQELYFSTDEFIQKIVLLRPIDIFFSLFKKYQNNTKQLLDHIKKYFPNITSQNLASFICQILIDREGRYFQTQNFDYFEKNKSKIDRFNNIHTFRQITWRQIQIKTKDSLIQMAMDLAADAYISQRQDRLRFIGKGLLLYYSRLFKYIYLVKIDFLSSEACRIIGSCLQQCKQFLNELDKKSSIKFTQSPFIKKVLSWINRFWQIILLVKDVPKLPNISLQQALTLPAEYLHPAIFRFLTKDCKEDLFHQMKKIAPSLITADFFRIYMLYCEVQAIKQVEKIIEICKAQKNLPQYFIDYLVKSKKLPQAILWSQSKTIKQPVSKNDNLFYQKIKEFKLTRCCLKEKQKLLIEALILLDRIPQNVKIDKIKQQNIIKSFLGRIKLQQLIIQSYHYRVSKKTIWSRLLSSIFEDIQKDSYKHDVMDRLNSCVIEIQFLDQIINTLQDPLLKVMYAYYFEPYSFEEQFFKMAKQIAVEKRSNFIDLNNSFKEELYFMLCKARLQFSFEQVMIIIDSFLELLSESLQIQIILQQNKNILNKELFWYLSFCAQFGIDRQKVYLWAFKRLNQLDIGSRKRSLLQLSLCYLAIDILPEKTKDLKKHFLQSESTFSKHICTILIQ